MQESGAIVLIADPRVLSIPIQDNGEPLVDLKDQTEILFGGSPEIENNLCYTKMRESIYRKLMEAEGTLPAGFRICLYEALRTVSLQKHLFDERWKKIRAMNPSGSDSEIYQEVIRMVSPVVTLEGEVNVPPHATGAAVDVYLVDAETHAPVDMGILAKDWMQDTEGVLSCTHSDRISKQARENRRVLSEAMMRAGFVNYPTEYWHWSYGDRYWAFVQGKPHAIFGPVGAK